MKQTKALRRYIKCGFVDLSFKTVQASGRGNDRITPSESCIVYWMDNKPDWLMCCLARWKRCPVLAPLLCDNTGNPVTCEPSSKCWIHVPPRSLPPNSPGSFCLFFRLQNIIIYCSLCADKKMCFPPWKSRSQWYWGWILMSKDTLSFLSSAKSS